GNDASLEAWFPGLPYAWIDVADPNNPSCINLMATGMRLADRIHTVSPSYAEEIAFPSREPHFYGAEGLEQVVTHVRDEGRLVGILNGCPELEPIKDASKGAQPWTRLLQRELIHWTAGLDALPARHFAAFEKLRLVQEQSPAPKTILTTVGRAVDQKMRLLRENGSNGRTALEQILETLGPDGLWIVLAAGDPGYESHFARAAASHDNFIFLNGYSDISARLLYAKGDLFIMPSSYEPCGISQLLAMRNSTPCVVHGVGGLRDTVKDKIDGFVFQGWTVAEQVDRLAATTAEAIAVQRQAGRQWQEMCRRAAEARFEWSTTARHYRKQLYEYQPAKKK
ncbi:MAG: glycosyltransferase, partial [Desulfosarcinaceae bacterium]